jgi:hypothetical protein
VMPPVVEVYDVVELRAFKRWLDVPGLEHGLDQGIALAATSCLSASMLSASATLSGCTSAFLRCFAISLPPPPGQPAGDLDLERRPPLSLNDEGLYRGKCWSSFLRTQSGMTSRSAAS